MRLALTLLSLALLVVAPVAQAYACTCAVATAPQCGCCCSGNDRGECDCCDDPAEQEALGEDCPCTTTAPQTADVPVFALPAAGALGLVFAPFAEPVTCTRAIRALRGDPHPEVVLPLLL